MSDGDQEYRPTVTSDGTVKPAITAPKNTNKQVQNGGGLLSGDVGQQPTIPLTANGNAQNNPNIEFPAIQLPVDLSAQETKVMYPPARTLEPGDTRATPTQVKAK